MACTAARNLFFFLTTTKKRSRFLLQIELIDVDKAALTTKSCSEKFFSKLIWKIQTIDSSGYGTPSRSGSEFCLSGASRPPIICLIYLNNIRPRTLKGPTKSTCNLKSLSSRLEDLHSTFLWDLTCHAKIQIRCGRIRLIVYMMCNKKVVFFTALERLEFSNLPQNCISKILLD